MASSQCCSRVPSACWALPVKVVFEPPRLSVGGVIDLPIGPKSTVQLTTTYLSEDVRLGKGSRGSLFVFTHGGPSNDAGQPARWRLEGKPSAHRT